MSPKSRGFGLNYCLARKHFRALETNCVVTATNRRGELYPSKRLPSIGKPALITARANYHPGLQERARLDDLLKSRKWNEIEVRQSQAFQGGWLPYLRPWRCAKLLRKTLDLGLVLTDLNGALAAFWTN